MDDNLRNRLAATEETFEGILVELVDPNVLGDQNRYREVTQKHSELKAVVDAYRCYLDAEKEIEEAEDLLGIEDDPEMVEYLKETISERSTEVDALETALRVLLVPKDPDDDKDVIVEVRSAAGGDEAAMWAADLYRMYDRFAERSGWALESIDVAYNEGGGIKEATFAIKGKGAYARFKFEAGPHRVQRVPRT